MSAILVCVAALWAGRSVCAQVANPVYPDVSPIARETLQRVDQFVASGNDGEAVRELQRLLEQQAQKVVPSPAVEGVYTSVRRRVHEALLSNPVLLERYRAAEGPRAESMLAAGDAAGVEATRLLTRAGFEAALRVAQADMEAARFDAARLTLEQLESHPDRRAGDGLWREAALLMRELARYLGREDVLATAARWGAEAGLPAGTPADGDVPDLLKVPMAGLMRPAAQVEAEGVPARPLWSTQMEPAELPPDAWDEERDPRQGTPDLEENRWIVPVVAGDTVYLNDGTWVSARDRFTLQPRWIVRPTLDGGDDAWQARRIASMQGVARQVEDTCSVTVAGRVLIATTGLGREGERAGDPRTHAFDAATGRVLWSVDVSLLDLALDGASVRGPAMVDGDTVVLAARKSAQGRRIVSLYLVGLSLSTGELRWSRLIASAGAIPWSRERRLGQPPVLHEGVVYCADQLGVSAAVEAGTGRVVWVRPAPVVSLGTGDVALPWQWDSPVIDGDGVIILSADHRDALRLDRATGRLSAHRTAGALGEPAYLLKAGDRLAAVSSDRIALVPLGDVERGMVRSTRSFGTEGIRGRVVVAGDRLLVPVASGAAVLNPGAPDEEPVVIPLDNRGNILPLPSQLLVLDAQNLHSYLTWTVAQRLLGERMSADPDDPEPAVTLAELAYRAGHPELIAPAADKALAAVERRPAGEAGRAARRRLFTSLRQMVETTEAAWTGAEAPADPQRASLPSLEIPVLAAVIERLGRSAQSHDERVAYYLAMGRLREAQATFGAAVEMYQAVLADPALAAATWRAAGVTVRAELEATRRVRQLLADHGGQVYGAFDAEAARALASLGQTPGADDLERLARRYPAASVTARAWAAAADAHEQAGRTHAGLTALREGLVTAEHARGLGEPIGAAMLGELAGRLVSRLRQLDQLFAAAQLLGRLRAQYPDLVLTDRGTTLDSGVLVADLVQRLAALERLPRIGPEIRPEVQSLADWAIMPPISRAHPGRACEHVVLISDKRSQIALWGAGAAAAAPGPSHLQMLWGRDYTGLPPVLLRLDPEAVYLYWDRTAAGGAYIERIDTVGGATRWKTEPFDALFAPDAELRARLELDDGRIQTPLDGMKTLRDLIIAIDEQVVAVVERSGRIAAFDPSTGKLLWSTTGPVGVVYDAAAGGGTLAVGGDTAGPAGPQPAGEARGAEASRPFLAVYDARTGNLVQGLAGLPEQIRWLRMGAGPGGPSVVVGLELSVESIDPVTGKTNWTLADTAGVRTGDAWVFGDRLFLLDANRSLWMASVATGRAGGQPVETYEHLVDAGRIEATPIGPNVAFATARGAVIIDPQGRLAGIDALDGGGGDPIRLIPPAVTESLMVALRAEPVQAADGRPAYPLFMLDAASGMLRPPVHQIVLGEGPSRLAVLDGRIVITAGRFTLVFSAPELDR